jgi:serine/threonine protein kinase
MTYMYAVAAGLIIGVMGVGAYILLVDGVSRKRNKRREAISILEGDIVRKRYEMKREIGSGGSCVVWEALDLESKKRVAVKVVSKSACTPHQRTYVYLHPSSMFLERLSYKPTHTPRSLIINEINIMERMTKSSGHPNVVNMLDKIETSEYYFIVMDLCDGGELFLRLSERGEGFPEAQAKDIARQLIEATIFMHGQGIMHRDMKPENVVFNSKNDDRHVKVIDWGLVSVFFLLMLTHFTPQKTHTHYRRKYLQSTEASITQ